MRVYRHSLRQELESEIDFHGPPYSCLKDLIDNYMYCGQELSQEQKTAAYEAFKNTTGFVPFDWSAALDTLSLQAQQLFAVNSYYFFAPYVMLLSVILYILLYTSRIVWWAETFFYLMAAILLYGFGLVYRIQAKNTYLAVYQQMKQEALVAQQNFQDSLALWIQGSLASSCAVVNDGCTPAWTCNECCDSSCDSSSEDECIKTKRLWER